MRKYLLLITLLFLLLSAGCQQAIEMPKPVDLMPFSSQATGLTGLVPEAWNETDIGRYMFEDGPSGPATLVVQSEPGMTIAHAAGYVADLFGLAEMPESGRYETDAFTWYLYNAEVQEPGQGPAAVNMALAQSGGNIYAVVLQSPLADASVYHASVFIPVVDSLEPLPFEPRDRLTYGELLAGELPDGGPVNNAYLMPLGNAAPAKHSFEGALTIPEFKMASETHNGGLPDSSHAFFPAVTVDFFTFEDFLVPVEWDIVPDNGDKSFWHIIFSPGKVWSEPADLDQSRPMSRASFPFTLVSDDSNEAHNGLATFLYDDVGISSLYLQVPQETAAWHHTDFWGQTPATYEKRFLQERSQLASQAAGELCELFPIRPWSELEETVPPSLLATFTGRNDLKDVSATGLVWDGTIYLQGCYTRYGNYPYCQYMRHGVMSVTKSMGAAIAILRLAQKYGDRVFDLKIADYVEVTAEHDGWDEVTFGEALNMATGVGENQPQPVEPNVIYGDEDQAKFSNFLRAYSAQDKLDIAFSYKNYPWGPGEIARYNSINTFILSAAMDGFLKSEEGPDADIWDMVVEEVYNPIGICHAPIMRTVEPDGARGLPIFGYGLYPTVDDVAKVAALLHEGGRHEGQQLLHPAKVAQALYQTGTAGFPSGQMNEDGEIRYNLSFWGYPYRSQGGETFIVPYMSGFGGNMVVLNPNGVTTFRFSDAHNYNVDPLVRVADAVEPFAR